MKNVTPKKSGTRTLRRTSVLVATACASMALCSAVAMAQSGGTVAPSDPAPPPPTTTAPSDGPTQIFPVPSAHRYGDGFGAGRNHMGVDIFAPCGTSMVSVMNTKVIFKGHHRRAGNYVVLRNKKIKRDYVYMHLQAPSPLKKKAKVLKGQFVGAMGDTGNASGCHLHFEIWKGKWYRGGRALNPMRSLRAWDSYS